MSATHSWFGRCAVKLRRTKSGTGGRRPGRIVAKNSSRSAAVVNAGVDLRHDHLRLDVMDPVVMGYAFLGRAGEAEDRGGQSASGDGGKSELLHFGAFFLLCVWHCVCRFHSSPCRSDLLNTALRASCTQLHGGYPRSAENVLVDDYYDRLCGSRSVFDHGVLAFFGDACQESPQHAPPAVHPRCDRANRGLHEIGYLFGTETLDVGVVDREAELVR
jgi:hypothetical protein